MFNWIKSIGNTALDLIYPPALYCICCGKIIDDTMTYRLCNECMDGIKWVSDRRCAKCGKRLSDADPLGVCYGCREHPHAFRRGYTCTEYGTHERAMVFSLKYDGRSDIADTLGEIMADRMMAEFDIKELQAKYDLVLPVPVHPSKKSIRGYNQAALMAASFARRTGLRSDSDVLVRVRETHIMRSLGPDQRRENIRGAFAVRPRRLPDIEGKTILLVDDIYTTGATIDEIAGVLRAPWQDKDGCTHAGASAVDFLTFASGADMIKAS